MKALLKKHLMFFTSLLLTAVMLRADVCSSAKVTFTLLNAADICIENSESIEFVLRPESFALFTWPDDPRKSHFELLLQKEHDHFILEFCKLEVSESGNIRNIFPTEFTLVDNQSVTKTLGKYRFKIHLKTDS